MSPSGANLSDHHRMRRPPALMIAAALIALAVWVTTGAYRWRGYPAEIPGGRFIAAILGLLAIAILLTVCRLALSERSPSRSIILSAVACWTVARLVTTSLFPLGSDEAYHWLWARHLDLCYYDHPAMVAWWARLLAPGGGEAAALVRLSSVVLGAMMPLMAGYLAWITLRDAGIALTCALLFMLTPILSGSTFLMPAVPVLFFWLLSMTQLWRALESNVLRDWLLLGLAYGGALNCNFTTFLFPICAIAYLLVSPAHRRLLTKPGPYLAMVVSVACFFPVILWNSENQWLTLGFNFARRHRDLSFHPDKIAMYLGQVLLYVSPILAIGGITAVFKVMHSPFRIPHSALFAATGKLFLAAMGLGPLLAFMITSAVLKARAHYAAPAFVPLLILFVWACRGAGAGRLRRWYRPAVILGTIMTIGFWCVLLLTALVPAPAMHRLFTSIGEKDPDKPTAELYGWPALGSYLDSFNERMDARSRTVVIAISYAQASLAIHYSRNLDYAFSLDENRSPYGQQFKLWGPLKQIPPGCNAIYFRAGRVPDMEASRKELESQFDRVETVDTTAPGLDPALRYFTIWKGYGYRGNLEMKGLP